MKKIFFYFLCLHVFIWVVPSINAQRSLQQYLQLSGLPYSTIQVPASAINTAALTSSNDNISNQVIQNQRPTTGLPTFSALSLPSLIAELSKTNTERPLSIHTETAPSIDAKLLNNLAIALQLLIISNIMNSPPPESTTEHPELIQPVLPDLTQTQPIQAKYYIPQENLNPVENFKNYLEQTGQKCQPSRRSSSLIKSPYEAIISTSFEDHTTQYSPLNSRRNLKSPYSMIDKDTNLFSMNGLF